MKETAGLIDEVYYGVNKKESGNEWFSNGHFFKGRCRVNKKGRVIRTTGRYYIIGEPLDVERPIMGKE